MNDVVSQTLKKWRQTNFVWGKSDCLISLADYLIDCGYKDFAIPFRNNFNDEIGAGEFIENYGGEIQIINTTNLKETNNPVRGDIVLVYMLKTKITGLCTGENIAFRTVRGVVEIRSHLLEQIKAWKVEKCHQ